MVRPLHSGRGGGDGDQKSKETTTENLDDEVLLDSEEEYEESNYANGNENSGVDVGSKDATIDELTKAGMNVGEFLSSGSGELNFGADVGGDSGGGDGKPSFKSELEKIYKVLTRTSEKLETDETNGISDEIRNDFEEYKTLMEDITPNKDGGVFKRVLQAGNGAQASVGKIVKFHYNSYIEGQDEPFDTSLIRGCAQKNKLGDGRLIQGLEYGLSTMKEGELADFVLDHSCAYGLYGSPPNIPPECTIRLTVRLVEVFEEDPVDALSREERVKLPFKETTDYILRKLDQGKKNFARAKYNSAINRYKDAREQIESMITTGWTQVEKDELKELRIRLYKNLGTCYVKTCMPSKIEIYLKKLEALGMSDAKTHFLQAKLYHMQGDYDGAVTELQVARNKEPGNTEIMKLLAQVKKEKSEYDAEYKEQAKRMVGGTSKD